MLAAKIGLRDRQPNDRSCDHGVGDRYLIDDVQRLVDQLSKHLYPRSHEGLIGGRARSLSDQLFSGRLQNQTGANRVVRSPDHADRP
jgi:hypothetical protein